MSKAVWALNCTGILTDDAVFRMVFDEMLKNNYEPPFSIPVPPRVNPGRFLAQVSNAVREYRAGPNGKKYQTAAVYSDDACAVWIT